MTSERKIMANRENAQKSTGPKTEEGKARSSMNNLKHGRYLTRFYKIKEQAGKLLICRMCGQDQINDCKAEKTCLLQDQLTLRYAEAHLSGDPVHVERINIPQIATMDLIFSQKLRYAQMHLGEKEEYTDAEGKTRKREMINTEYIYMLINMMKALNKGMTDMQLTRQTQETIDVAWAELAKAEVSPEKAAETKERILKEMQRARAAAGKAGQLEEADEAIRRLRTEQEDETSGAEVSPDMGQIAPSPFGRK